MNFLMGILFIGAFIYYLFENQIQRSAHFKQISESGIDQIDKLKGIHFEDYLLTLFRKLGYSATQTKASGDYGADLILFKDGVKIVVQAKRYSKRVGVKSVQEVYSAISMYGASIAWVVTNNYFTDPAVQMAKANSVRLVDRDELMRLMIQSKN